MAPTDKRHNWFGLVFAYRLDGQGGGTPLGWKDIEERSPGAADNVWLHLDLRHPNALHWLRQDSGLDALTVDGLAAARASPRLVQRDDTLLLILKGIDYRAGAQAGDMVAMRLWTDGRLLISCRRERVRAVADLAQELGEGQGPADIDGLIAALTDRLMTHADDVLEDLLQETHRIGHASDAKHTENLVAELAMLRRRMMRMRFHLVPQRRALGRLGAARLPWLGEQARRQVRDVADRCLQATDGLYAAGEITEITQDEILQRSSETTERRLFSLTVITAVFLPLTFITGLLGVNLAGIPDADDPYSFLVLCLLLGGLVGAQLWMLRRKGWL